MSTLHRSLFGAVLFSGLAAAQTTTAQLTPVNAPAPIHAGTYYAATGQFVPFDPNEAQLDLPSDVIYNNNHYTGWFYDINDGTQIIDEGRIPSTSSPAPVGLNDSYRINTIQIGYVTDSVGDCSARLTILNEYATCTLPSPPFSLATDLTITGLPGTLFAGTLTPYTFDVDLSGLEFCMLADGDGAYSTGTDDRFGWALKINGDVGAQTGPIVGSLPGPFAPEGDGTVFQNPGAPSGTGLGTVDQWYDIDPINGNNCYNHGGYDPVDGDPAFGSYWLVLGSDLAYSCTGCENGLDDGFEDNDDCTTAAPVASPSVNPGLVSVFGDDDYYRVTIPPFTELTAEISFSNSQADLDLFLYNDDCSTTLDTSGTLANTETVSYLNCSALPVDVTVLVNNFFSAINCGDYSMELSELPIGCTDDLLEDNDDCSQAYPISQGFTPNLVVSVCDEDYYSITLDPGESMNFAIFFSQAEMDLDLYLYPEGAATCGTRTGNEWLTRGFSASNDEFISWTNTTGQVQDYIVKVEVWVQGSTELCTGYDVAYIEGGGGGVGTNFCTAVLNSTGLGAHIFGTGSDSFAANDLVLNCEFLPNNSFGFFLASQTQIFVPQPGGVAAGNLCIAGPMMGRYNANLLNTGTGTTVSLAIDNTIIPQPTVAGSTSAMVGATWNFQYYYRDINGPFVSNFSDAMYVTFQ